MFLPGLNNADTILAVCVAHFLLIDGAYLESLGNFLPSVVTISDTCILIFLLLHGPDTVVALLTDFVDDAEFTLADFLNDVEAGVKAVAIGKRIRYDHL